MSKIVVETDELTAFATKYKKLVDEFDKVSEKIISKTKSYDDYWKGSFTSDLDEKVKSLTSVRKAVVENGNSLVTFVNGAVEQYIKVDRNLADQSTINNSDYPDNVKVSVHVMSQQELQSIYSNSTNTTNIGYNPNGSYSCAWLSKRKAQQHGFNANWSGNGKDVVNNIKETNDYSVTKYSGGNCLQDLINSEGQPVTDVVVSFPLSPNYGSQYGHVLYIDQIVDGKVYYSDNTNPSKACVKTIDEFLSYYKKYNGTPSGCAHLKKK
jgi:uncharacterized protein YukE